MSVGRSDCEVFLGGGGTIRVQSNAALLFQKVAIGFAEASRCLLHSGADMCVPVLRVGACVAVGCGGTGVTVACSGALHDRFLCIL